MKKSHHAQFLHHRLGYSVGILGRKALKLVFPLTCRKNLGSGPPAFNCWISVAPAFQSWFTAEYSSDFISVMTLDLYVRCFDSLRSRGLSRGPNNLYVYMNLSRT